MALTNYYQTHLDYALSSAYARLLDAVVRHQGETNIGQLSSEDFNKAYSAVSLDHGEYAYFTGVYAALMSDGTVRIPYLAIDETYYTSLVNDAVSQIYALTRGSADEYVKVKAIFDYLCTHTEYDDDCFKEFARISRMQNSDAVFEFARDRSLPFSSYAVFAGEKALCQGIAKAFKILCDLFGIDCMCVLCTTKTSAGGKGTPHILNRVCVNGVESYVDVTNCMATPSFPMVRYDFFLCSREQVEKAFIFDEDLPGVEGRDNYFVKGDLIFDKAVPLRRFLSSFDASKNDRKVRFRYTGREWKEDEVGDIATEILNRHAPSGKQWVSMYQHGCFNALLCDQREVERIQENRQKSNK